MTRHRIFICTLFALLLFVASDAYAIDTTIFPGTLVDHTCTDLFDTVPTGWGAFGTAPFVQTTGDPDNLCDHDNRILTNAFTAGTTSMTPISSPGDCYYIFVDAATVSGGDSGWKISTSTNKVHDGTSHLLYTSSEVTGTGDVFFTLGHGTGFVIALAEDDLDLKPPHPIVFQLNLAGATSWEGSISLVGC